MPLAAISRDRDELRESQWGKENVKTHLGESVGAGGELPQLHVEVLVVGVLLLRLQVVVPLGASCRRNEWDCYRAKMTSGLNTVNLSLHWKKKNLIHFFFSLLERKSETNLPERHISRVQKLFCCHLGVTLKIIFEGIFSLQSKLHGFQG